MNSSILLRPPTWGDQLLNEPILEEQFIVPGVLSRRDRVIVTGGEGEGKSTLVRQFGIMCALGIHPFTLMPMPRLRVLNVDLENDREQAKAEFRKITERAGVEMPGEPYFSFANWPSGLNLVAADYEAAFKEVLKDFQPDLIVGGPLYKMAESSLTDENVSRQIAAALDRLRADFNFAIMLEAHQVNEQMGYDPKKGDFVKNRPPRPFGSSLWRRWPEFGICLFYNGTLFHWRGQRQTREWPQKLQRDGDTWLWEPDGKHCPVCGEDKPEGAKYCSTKCRETAKKRRQRLNGLTSQEELP